MSREVRRVPKGWEAPLNPQGRKQTHFDQDYASAVTEWKEGYEAWKENPKSDCEYWEYHGDPPDPAYFRPAWTDDERTHLMMYETTTEGTPISPAMETPEELAQWLVDSNASAFGSMTATYDQWLATIKRGRAMSMMFSPGKGLESGVAAMASDD